MYGWDNQFLGFRLRRLAWFRGFLRLGHWGLLGTYHDFRRSLRSIAYHTGVCHFILCRNVMNGPEAGWGSAEGVALKIWPHRRSGSNQVPNSPARRMALLRSTSVRQESCLRRPLTAFKSRLFRKRSHNLLPLHLLPVAGSLVSSTAAALKLLFFSTRQRGDTFISRLGA